MDWLCKIYCGTLLLHLLILPVVRSELLPDELVTDDAEILAREKRDGFFERLFKTFPLFKHDEEEKDAEMEEEAEANTVELDIPEIPSFEINILDSSSSTVPLFGSTESAMFTSPTLSLQSSTVNLIASSTEMMTRTPFITTAPTQSSSTVTKVMMSTQISVSRSMSTDTISMPRTEIKPTSTLVQTSQPTAALHTSLPTATVESGVKTMFAVEATASSKPASSATNKLNGHIYGMELVLEAPRLPDERGYGNVLAQAPTNDDHDVKSAQFMFNNLMIPIMSGLCGALCISLIIMLIKCIRKRRLRKIRYYGGKPQTRLYGLDHMGLLSDMSSDEE